MKQKKRKRLLNLLVTLAMVTGLMQGISLTAYADGEHTHDGVTFVEWTDALAQEQWDNSGRTAANSLPVEAGNYYLTQDVTLTDQWNIPSGTTNLCLGGKTITGNLSESANHDYSVVFIEGGSTLNLCDDEEGAGKIVSEEYTFTEEGRKFTVMVTDVHVYNSTFNMYGGTLCATDGKQIVNGVVVNGGTFTMAGGTIRGARLSGVFVGSRGGVFTMNGGTITGNRALHGGGVAVDENGVFTMNGGSIAGNEAFFIETKDAVYKGGQGGGVYVEAGGVFTMNGGSITGNDAQRHGGGVYNKGTFRISGAPEISGNTHTHAPGDPCADNVYLERDKVVNVAGELTGTKPIGITMQDEDVFTSGEASGYKAKFASDYEEFTVAVKGKELMLQHLRHSMSYEASGATVTAECAWPASCSLPGGKVALTIKAPARTTYGGEGSAAATLEGLDNFNEACGLSLAAADIRYYKARKNGSTYTKDGDALGAAPSDAGDFLAEMPVPTDGEGACVYATVSYTIAKAASVVTKAPAARKLTYTEMAQKLVTKGEAAGGTMQYALGTETEATDPFTASIPTGTNVGTYYVWYKVHGDDNHNDTNPVCVISRISSPPSGPSTISATVTFKVAHGAWDDGTKDNKTVTLTGYSPLTLSTSQIPAVGSKPDEGYKAGSWDTVPATSITRSITFTYSYVKKPAASITKEPTARDLTENGKPQELVTAGEATGGTMEYALGVTADGWSTSIPTATNARVYYVWNKVVGDADHSSTEPKCIVVTVKYGPGTLIYNGKDQELVKPGTVQGGTMMYVLGTDDVTAPGEGWTDVIPKGKEVGDYYVWYKVLGDANHKDTESRCIKVTIVPDSQVEQFEELIKTLPEKVTLENSDLVKALRALYDSLSDDQKKLIPEEDVRKLEATEEKINELNRAAAERFTIAVNSIAQSEAGEGKGMLDVATEIYNNITEEQKALVSDDTMALYNEAIAAFKKDRQFRSGDAYYKVLSNGDVTYLKPASKDITNVTVPNQVKKGKFLFKVIKVSNNAFRNCGNLKWAVIGKNVRVFGEYVFARAYNLKKVRVLGYGFKSGKVTNAFVKAGKKGKLTVKVPGNKVDEYQKLFTGEGKLNGKVEAA